MKMTAEQFEVWAQAVNEAGEHYNDLIYFLDCLDSADKLLNHHYYTQPFIYTVFPEFTKDTRRFVHVWLDYEPIEVED